LAAPIGQYIMLRARGQVASGEGNGSGGFIDSEQSYYLADRVFRDGFD